MAMNKNSATVLEYLQKNNDENLTAADVATACNLSIQQVNGIFTSAIQRKEMGKRVPAEIELEDGTHKGVKFLKLTEKGMNFDPYAAEETAE